MAIGLEIELAVPIDALSTADINNLRADIHAANNTPVPVGALPNPQNTAAGQRVRTLIHNNGRAQNPVGGLRPAANGFRIDADHDDRVKTNNAWPPFEGGEDSIIEIVMDPPAADAAAFNTAMNNIQAWVNNMMLQTNNLTRRWQVTPNWAIGPLTFPVGGGHPALLPRPRRLNHNLKGSVQVNIGIDLREYHSMMKWFAHSRGARSHNEQDPAHQAIYRQSKDDMRDAVNIGRTLTARYAATLTALQTANMGNLRGLRGWITHMALYIKRGAIGAGVLGGTTKNLAPVLLKSPPAVAALYGMTADEQAYFNLNSVNIVNDLLNAVGRAPVAGGGALAGTAIFNAAAIGVGGSLADLTNLGGGAAAVPLTGRPIIAPTGVGPARGGNAAVTALPAVGGAAPAVSRGGVVAEFRNIPGYYEGVASWRALGLQFLKEANKRNRRSGIAP